MLKKFLSLLKNQIVLLLFALVVLLLAVYFAWPLFGASTAYRKSALLLIGFAGLILIAVSAIPHALEASRRRRSSRGSLSQELNRALEALAEECPGRGSLYKVERALRLPWVLVLGSAGSGKSAALSHASFARPFKDPGARFPLCTFWLAQDVIFVHPRARLRSDELLWKEFLAWLAQRHRVDALLLQLSTADLVGRRSDEIEQLAGGLQRSLWEVTQQLGTGLPLQILINQCDRLDGFVRFFAELPDSERAAAWGLSLTAARDLQFLGPLVVEGFAGLTAALLARSNDPFRRARNLEEQAAVLAFPQELQRLGEATARFVDALYPRGPGEGRAQLKEIALASTLQEGQPLSGVRHELVAEGQLIRIAPGTAVPLTNVGAFFLRQPLLRLQARAVSANRPRLHWHVTALITAGVACAGISMMLGHSFAHYAKLMERIQRSIAGLENLSALSSASDELQIRNELSGEDVLRQQICTSSIADDQPDCVPEELTRPAQERAVEYLGCRISYELVRPKLEQHPGELYRRLDKLATWNKQQSPRDLVQGFNALKLTTMLLKRNDAAGHCTPRAADRKWAAEYLADLWGSDRDYGEALRRNLGMFIKLYLKTDQSLLKLPNQDRIDKARENLKKVFGDGSGNGDAETLFYLSSSQLSSGVPLLVGTVLTEGQRLPKLYMDESCAQFFNPTESWDLWISCVRGEPSTELAHSSSTREGLRSYYLAEHQKAWVAWLNALKQGKQLNPDDLDGINRTIQGLGQNLTQVFLMMGRGPLKKESGKAKLPETCAAARRVLEFFPAAAGAVADLEPEAAQLPATYKGYLEALGKAGTAVKALSDWPANSLKPEADALQALAELASRRADLISALNGALARLAQNPAGDGESPNLGLTMDGLNRTLAGFEEELHGVVIARLRRYLRDRWEPLYGEWKGLRARATADAANPDSTGPLRAFLKEKVTPFLDGSLVPLYTSDFESCQLKPPLGGSKRPVQLLSPKSCRQLAEARVLASLAPAAPAPAPAAPAAPPAVQYEKPQVSLPGCTSPPQEIILNIKERSLHYSCDTSTNRCRPLDNAPIGPAVLAVFTAARASHNETVLAGDQFIRFAKAYKNQPISQYVRGRLELSTFPGPGSCQTRVYLDPAMLNTPTAPRAPANPLLSLLPPSPEELLSQ